MNIHFSTFLNKVFWKEDFYDYIYQNLQSNIFNFVTENEFQNKCLNTQFLIFILKLLIIYFR